MVLVENNDLVELQQDEETSREVTAASTGAASLGDLRQAEGGSVAGVAPANDANTQAGRMRRFASRFSTKGWGAKQYVIAIGGLTGAVALFGGVAFLLFFASLFKIPNLSQSIIEYNFATLTREFGSAAERTYQEALAAQTADPELRAKLIEQYESAGTKETIGDKILKQVSVNAAIRNLTASGSLEFISHNLGPQDTKNPLLWGRTQLDAIRIGDQTFEVVPQRGLLRSFIPKFIDIPYLARQAAFARDFVPALRIALADQGLNIMMRGAVASRFRSILGIHLITWLARDYIGKTPAQAEGKVTQDLYQEVAQGSENAHALTNNIESAEEAVGDATTREVEDNVQAIIKNEGISAAGTKALAGFFGQDLLGTITSVLNPVYGVALPACIVYDGSLQAAGPTINKQAEEQVKLFHAVATAADQEKNGNGDPADWQGQLTAISAWNAKIGDPSTSNVYLRANGQAVNTTSQASAETDPLGNYTLVDLLPGGSSGGGQAFENFATKACPLLTDLRVAIPAAVVLQVATIAADIPSLGGATEGEVALSLSARELLQHFAESFIGGEITTGNVLSKIGATTTKFAKDTGLIVGATFAARAIVMAKSGQFFNGLDQGAPLANQVDSGANITAGELCRQQLFCRPLTCTEVAQTDAANKTYIAESNQQKSFSERYLALNNPDSLMARTATMMSGQFSGSLLANLFNIFSGPFSFGTIFGSLTGSITYAATPCAQQHYGNVQFGWSEDEEKLIDSDYSYLPLENQQILDQSAQEDTIAEKYASCFGYKYNASGTTFDPTDDNSKLQEDITEDGSIGTLLSSGDDIVRTKDGDIVPDQGLCSPQNLGPNNPVFGGLVFRWRLAMRYYTTTDQLLDLQKVTTQ